MSLDATSFLAGWNLLNGWVFFIGALITLYLVGAFRLRRRGGARALPATRILFTFGGYLALLLAVSGPFEVFSDRWFWAHMVQHLLIAMVGAPLLLAANTMPVYVWALPKSLRHGAAELLERRGPLRIALTFLTNPKFAWIAFILLFYAWHITPLYEAALRYEAVHFVEHLTMFSFSIFFWWVLIGPAPLRSRASHPVRLVYLVAAMTATAALGAGITFASNPFYSNYLESAGSVANALGDQRLAGIVLWIPGNIVYLTALVTIFLRWAAREMRV